MKRYAVKFFLTITVIMLMVSTSYGAGSLFGQGVTMTPALTNYNTSVTLTVTFRVDEAPVSFFPHELAVRKSGESLPPPPTIVGATPTTFPVGNHQLNIQWTVPEKGGFHWPGSNKDKRFLKFDIVWGKDRQVLIRNAMVYGTPSPLKLENRGTGMRVYPTPAVAGGSVEHREPALEIARPQFKDGGRSVDFYVHKPGTGFAVNVRWEIEGFIDGRWQHVANGVIPRINAGNDAHIAKGGFPSATATKARIKIVSPAPEVSAEMTKPWPDLNPSNCHVQHVSGGYLDIGLGISNLGDGDAGTFVWDIRKHRDGRWVPFHSERVTSINAGGRYAKGGTRVLWPQDIQRNEPLQIWVDTRSTIHETNEENNICEVIWRGGYIKSWE